MDDAVDRKADELREQRRQQEERAQAVKTSCELALAEFVQELDQLHAANTKHPMEVSNRPGHALRVSFRSLSGSDAVSDHVVAEVRAVHYGESGVPVHLFLTPNLGAVESEQWMLKGAQPREMAARVADLTVASMASAVALGGRIVSSGEAATAEQQRRARLEREARERRTQADRDYDRRHRWDWVGRLIALALGVAFVRLVLFPWLRPLLESWFS